MPGKNFLKDGAPWNKGLKWNPGGDSIKTRFVKGGRSPRWKPIGTISVRTDRAGTKRNRIKIAEPNKWRDNILVVWEAHYGPLIPGDIVHHLNGDALDDRLENLIAMPRKDHPRYHGRWGIKQLTEAELTSYKNRYLCRKNTA